jgi:hypothetical protein
VDTRLFRPGAEIDFDPWGFRLTVKDYYKNCDAYQETTESDASLNASGIRRLARADSHPEPEKNIPGGDFTIRTSDGKSFDLLLFGGESRPTVFLVGDKQIRIILRLKRHPLPFLLELKDFMMEQHPGTDTARSFKSRVAIQTYQTQAWREKLISMNNPLRHKEYTFYQSSYSIDHLGRETSTLAVVKNAGRILPYAATFITFLGLAGHFIMMALLPKKTLEPPFVNGG